MAEKALEMFQHALYSGGVKDVRAVLEGGRNPRGGIGGVQSQIAVRGRTFIADRRQRQVGHVYLPGGRVLQNKFDLDERIAGACSFWLYRLDQFLIRQRLMFERL